VTGERRAAGAKATADAPLRGILFLVTGIAVFSTQDVIIRLLKDSVPVTEFVLLRSAFSLIPLAALIAWEGGIAVIRTRRPWLQLARGLLLLGSYTTYYMAVVSLPLADAVALFFITPLFVTTFSILLLRERVRPSRWIALVAGFAGVVVIVRPGQGMIELGAVFAIASAVVYALASILTRKMRTTESSTGMVFWMSMVYLGGSSLLGLATHDIPAPASADPAIAFFLQPWVVPAWKDLAWLAACGLVAIVGFICLVQAYRIAPASTVTPFEYTGILWGAFWGFVLWREVPDLWTLVGIGMVVGSGLAIIRQEAAGKPRAAG